MFNKLNRDWFEKCTIKLKNYLAQKNLLNPTYFSIHHFGFLSDGREVHSYRLQNENGIRAEIINFGATLRLLEVPVDADRSIDVVLGFDDLQKYTAAFDNPGNPYFGSLVGRHAGRIALGRFALNNQTILLDQNLYPHHLHGGKSGGFAAKYWNLESFADSKSPSVTLQYTSVDGEDGYPGELSVKVTYRLTPENELQIHYEAFTSADTIINLTNHSYFNLDSQHGDVTQHELLLEASSILETNDEMIPTGNMISLDEHPLNYQQKKPVSSKMDHGFVITTYSGPQAILYSRQHALSMEVSTNQPCMQVYVGGAYEKCLGKEGANYHPASGICFETQNYPDAPNHSDFPSAILRAGETYNHQTSFRFISVY